MNGGNWLRWLANSSHSFFNDKVPSSGNLTGSHSDSKLSNSPNVGVSGDGHPSSHLSCVHSPLVLGDLSLGELSV